SAVEELSPVDRDTVTVEVPSLDFIRCTSFREVASVTLRCIALHAPMPSSALPHETHLGKHAIRCHARLDLKQLKTRIYLQLDDNERLEGARFGHYPGSNAIVTCCTAVDKKGRLSRKSILAALRFLRQLKTEPRPRNVDLSEAGFPSLQQSSSSSALHVIHRGRAQEQPREDNPARGAAQAARGWRSRTALEQQYPPRTRTSSQLVVGLHLFNLP
ncbi:hypothetical protein AAVH_32042, partial [Aphelenchoides avenae]